MYNIEHKDLIKDLYYNEETGYFYWINPKQGRSKDKPAGTKTHHGYWIINYNGDKILTHRLAFFYMNGEWPTQMVGFKDNDPSNSAWDNLFLKSHEAHYAVIKERHREKKQNESPLSPAPRKRATFPTQEVTQAVEEFIKDRVLVEGVYVVRNEHTEALAKSGVSS